jgi:surface carbohydrate biosynthesis protein (TIGR04326 family)
MDISEVIYEDLKMDWIRGRVASTMLFYYFVKHLKKKRLLVDMVIYTFENQAWEKVLCMAMREFYPQAHSVGYQHSTFSMMHLSHFFSKPESSIMPLPDKIVTSGEHAKNVFIKAGYPRKKVVRGGAMRYVCSLELRAKRRKVRDKLTILVALSINKFEAAELIWKVLKAFENRAEFKVIIKCHPLMPLEKISKLLKMRLPAHFTISDKSITDLLKESDVLLYTGSTACVEAIAADIPVVHVESDLLIDLDKLDFDPTIRPSARSVEEITERVEDIINVTEEQLSKGRKKWRDVVKNLFGKVDDSTYRLFLPEV